MWCSVCPWIYLCSTGMYSSNMSIWIYYGWIWESDKKKKIIVCKVFSNTWKIWVIGKLKLPFWLKPKPKMVKIKQFGNVYKTQNFIVRKVQSCVGKHNSVFINNFFRFCNVVDWSSWPCCGFMWVPCNIVSLKSSIALKCYSCLSSKQQRKIEVSWLRQENRKCDII